ADSTACSTVRCSRSKRASSYPTATRTGRKFAVSSSTLSSTETTPAPANAFCAVVISRTLNVAMVSCAATGAARRETTSTSTATVTASFFMLILLPENKNRLHRRLRFASAVSNHAPTYLYLPSLSLSLEKALRVYFEHNVRTPIVDSL